MKKIFLTAIAVFGFTFANAQTGGFAKGDAFVSGALTIGSEKTGDDKTTTFEIEPRVGYFVTENIAIGAKLGYKSIKDVSDAFSVGAFGRYYLAPASQFSVFGQAGLDFSNIKDKATDGKENEIGANVGLGLSYFLSNHFAIEAVWAGLQYTVSDNGGDGAKKTNSFDFGSDLRAVHFGVIYKF